jgi:hypothetical protein
MAIINTFDRCLESGHLRRDEGARERTGVLLEQARERLRLAAGLAEGSPAQPGDAILLAYESMFASLRALVYRHGYRELGLRCLLLAAERLEVAPGRVSGEHLKAFVRVQGHQLSAQGSVGAARAFLEAVEGLALVES